MRGDDYYARLGVPPSIEPAALTAAYRALLKIYHPDVYRGPRARGERVTQELNEAYSVLGNAARRAAYDRERAGTAAGSRHGIDPVAGLAQRQWTRIAALHPDIERRRRELEALAPTLALDFQRALVARGSVAHAGPLAEAMKRRFVERHFGRSPVVQHFALGALKADRRDVAREVNRVIHQHGSPRPTQEGPFVREMRAATLWFGPFETPAHPRLQPALQFGIAACVAACVAAAFFWRALTA